MTTFTSLYALTASIRLDWSLVVNEVVYAKIMCTITRFIKNLKSNRLSNPAAWVTVSLFYFLSTLTTMSPSVSTTGCVRSCVISKAFSLSTQWVQHKGTSLP